MWVVLTWRIWHHRNRLIFSNEEFDGQKVKWWRRRFTFVGCGWKTWKRILKYLITYGPTILKLDFCAEGGYIYKIFCGWDLSCSSSQCFGNLIAIYIYIYKTKQVWVWGGLSTIYNTYSWIHLIKIRQSPLQMSEYLLYLFRDIFIVKHGYNCQFAIPSTCKR